MNKDYIEYDASGRIICTCSLSEEIYELNKSKPMVEGSGDPQLHYVSNGEISLRPEQLTTLTGLTLNNLPTPCQIIIDGTSYEVDEPMVELEFDEPGTHNIKIVAFPHLDKEFTVEA